MLVLICPKCNSHSLIEYDSCFKCENCNEFTKLEDMMFISSEYLT